MGKRKRVIEVDSNSDGDEEEVEFVEPPKHTKKQSNNNNTVYDVDKEHTVDNLDDIFVDEEDAPQDQAFDDVEWEGKCLLRVKE